MSAAARMKLWRRTSIVYLNEFCFFWSKTKLTSPAMVVKLFSRLKLIGKVTSTNKLDDRILCTEKFATKTHTASDSTEWKIKF